MRPLLLATCTAHPEGDEDGPALVAALAEAGIDASWAVWDDAGVDWSAAPVVLRSTWDYTLRRTEFLDWLGGLPQVWNPTEVVRWNSDKVYLLDLARAGVPVTPTTLALEGRPLEIPPTPEFVVKPSVGAGSRGAGRFAAADVDAAAEHAAALRAAGRTALVQPYLDGVDELGETALVYLGGEFSHAIRKGPMLGGRGTPFPIDESLGLYIEENITVRTPSDAELAVGERAVRFAADRFGAPLLYARVDLLPSADGPVVVELELTEPSLFLGHDDGAAARVASAVARCLDQSAA